MKKNIIFSLCLKFCFSMPIIFLMGCPGQDHVLSGQDVEDKSEEQIVSFIRERIKNEGNTEYHENDEKVAYADRNSNLNLASDFQGEDADGSASNKNDAGDNGFSKKPNGFGGINPSSKEDLAVKNASGRHDSSAAKDTSRASDSAAGSHMGPSFENLVRQVWQQINDADLSSRQARRAAFVPMDRIHSLADEEKAKALKMFLDISGLGDSALLWKIVNNPIDEVSYQFLNRVFDAVTKDQWNAWVMGQVAAAEKNLMTKLLIRPVQLRGQDDEESVQGVIQLVASPDERNVKQVLDQLWNVLIHKQQEEDEDLISCLDRSSMKALARAAKTKLAFGQEFLKQFAHKLWTDHALNFAELVAKSFINEDALTVIDAIFDISPKEDDVAGLYVNNFDAEHSFLLLLTDYIKGPGVMKPGARISPIADFIADGREAHLDGAVALVLEKGMDVEPWLDNEDRMKNIFAALERNDSEQFGPLISQLLFAENFDQREWFLAWILEEKSRASIFRDLLRFGAFSKDQQAELIKELFQMAVIKDVERICVDADLDPRVVEKKSAYYYKRKGDTAFKNLSLVLGQKVTSAGFFDRFVDGAKGAFFGAKDEAYVFIDDLKDLSFSYGEDEGNLLWFLIRLILDMDIPNAQDEALAIDARVSAAITTVAKALREAFALVIAEDDMAEVSEKEFWGAFVNSAASNGESAFSIVRDYEFGFKVKVKNRQGLNQAQDWRERLANFRDLYNQKPNYEHGFANNLEVLAF